VVALALMTRLASAASVTITWDANPEPDVAGYVVSYGPQSGAYLGSLDVGPKTTCVLPNLSAGTYYFAVRAYNSFGEISPYSTEIVARILQLSKPVPDVASPAAKGETVTWSTEVKGADGPVEYQFWLYHDKSGWKQLTSYGADNSISWRPLAAGQYKLQAWVRLVGSTNKYDAWNASEPFDVVDEPLKLTAVSVDPAGPIGLGTPVEVSATATGGVHPLQYQFWVFSQRSGKWALARDYGQEASFTYTPARSGEYRFQAWARSAGSTATYDAWKGSAPLQVIEGLVGLTSFTATPAGPVLKGTKVTLSAEAFGGSDLVYKFWALDPTTRKWTVLREYGTGRAITWTATSAGSYTFAVWVRRSGSSKPWEDWRGLGPYIVTDTLTVTSFTANVGSPVTVGTPVTLTAATLEGAAVEYKFWAFEATTRQWTLIRGYDNSPSVVWTPEAAGTFYFQAWVRRAGSSASLEHWKALGPMVVRNSLTITAFGTLASSPVKVWTPLTFTTSVAGVSEAVEYKFWLYRKESKAWSVLQDYSPDGQAIWVPSEPGTYTVQVWVRRVGSTATFEAWSASGPFSALP
jgi:hypothetical protein